MNKKGNVYLGLGLAIFIWVSGILIYPYILDDITTTRAELGCDNFADLSNGTQLVCIGISGLSPYFLWFLVSLFFGFILGGLDGN
jgi:hypothetical protein